MTCRNCENMICSHALREGKCKICRKTILTPHSPCWQYCEECANERHLCKQCGCEDHTYEDHSNTKKSIKCEYV